MQAIGTIIIDLFLNVKKKQKYKFVCVQEVFFSLYQKPKIALKY